MSRHLCRPCHNREKARGLGKYVCQKCHAIIDEQPLIFKNDPYHPDHFSCTNCGYEQTRAGGRPTHLSLLLRKPNLFSSSVWSRKYVTCRKVNRTI